MAVQATAPAGGRFTAPAARAQLLESALDSLSEAVVIVDEEEQPVYENAAAKTGNVNSCDTTFILTKEARIPRPDADAGAGSAAPLTVRVYSNLTRHPVAERIINAQETIVAVRATGPPPPHLDVPTLGTLEFASSALLRDMGITMDEAMAGHATANIHPEDVGYVVAALKESVARADAELRVCRYRHKMADGQYRWQQFSVLPVRNDAGTIVKWLYSSVDIDELTQMRAQLVEQRTMLETVFNQLPVIDCSHARCSVRARSVCAIFGIMQHCMWTSHRCCSQVAVTVASAPSGRVLISSRKATELFNPRHITTVRGVEDYCKFVVCVHARTRWCLRHDLASIAHARSSGPCHVQHRHARERGRGQGHAAVACPVWRAGAWRAIPDWLA